MLIITQLYRIKEMLKIFDRYMDEFTDRFIMDLDIAGFCPKSAAIADCAGGSATVPSHHNPVLYLVALFL